MVSAPSPSNIFMSRKAQSFHTSTRLVWSHANALLGESRLCRPADGRFDAHIALFFRFPYWVFRSVTRVCRAGVTERTFTRPAGRSDGYDPCRRQTVQKKNERRRRIGAPLIFAMNQYAWSDVSAIFLGFVLLVWGIDVGSARCGAGAARLQLLNNSFRSDRRAVRMRCRFCAFFATGKGES